MRPGMIVFIGFACTIVLIILFYILFLNRESDSVLPIIFKISAAVLAAAAILVIDLSKAPETMHLKTNFLLFRSDKLELLNLTAIKAKETIPLHHAYSMLNRTWSFKGYKTLRKMH